MAEQFRKTYISVTEFIDSWEKEIYELNYLDYFSYLLINELASNIENEFFPKRNNNDQINLSADEISTVAFNITDGLQGFFEKNCFGTCNFGCPSRLDETLDKENINLNQRFNDSIEKNCKDYETKEHCLSSDILNYVILDSLLDFYNYELGIILTETDASLLDFAEFTLNVILQFIRVKGQYYLKSPQENASDYFNDLIKTDESDWKFNDFDFYNNEDDEQDNEPWKNSYSGIENVFEDYFEEYYKESGIAPEKDLLDKFKTYLLEFLELKNVEDITIDDLEEFFSVVLPHEMLAEDMPCFDNVRDIFSNFLTYLEFSRDMQLKIPYEKFIEKNMPEIIRTFRVTVNYQKKYPLIDYLLSGENYDTTLIEGFYEIDGKADGLFSLKDIHLNTEIKPVNINRLRGSILKTSDIFHCQLVNKSGIWYLAHLEQVYPSVSKYYLY
ncbi:MAG: hypothetical protein P8X42_12790 [Calditrichaceae bacterium]